MEIILIKTVVNPCYGFFSKSFSDGLEQKENATEAFPIPQFSFAAEGLSSSSAAIPASSHQVKVSSVDLQMLLHKALDGENDDYVESGSGSGSGDRQVTTFDTERNSNLFESILDNFSIRV